MQIKWERTLNFTIEDSCVVCVHVFKIKVFFNPVVDSGGGELLISALNPNETVFLQQLVICSNSKPAADFVPFPSQTHTCTLGSSPTLTYRHSSIWKQWIYMAHAFVYHFSTWLQGSNYDLFCNYLAIYWCCHNAFFGKERLWYSVSQYLLIGHGNWVRIMSVHRWAKISIA